MGKKLLGVLLGAVAATVTIFALETLGHRLYPVPPGFNPRDPAALRAFLDTLPAGGFAFVLLAYAFGSFSGGLLATLVGGRAAKTPALVVGGLLTVAGVVNVMTIPQPTWFAVVSTLIYVPAAWLGSRLLLVPRG